MAQVNFIERFGLALKGSVDDLEKSIQQPASEGHIDELSSLYMGKLEDLQEAVEFNVRLASKSQIDLRDLVKLAQKVYEENQLVLESIAADYGLENPSSLCAASCNSNKNQQYEREEPENNEDELECKTPATDKGRMRGRSAQDSYSIDSDPKTPLLEDFGLSFKYSLQNEELAHSDTLLDEESRPGTPEDFTYKRFSLSADRTDNDRGGSKVGEEFLEEEDEAVELRYISKEEMEALPGFLQKQVTQEELNDVFTVVGQLACSNGSELVFTFQELEEACERSTSFLRSSVLCLIKQNRLENIGQGKYRLIPSQN